jgi:hypothetical protein
MNLTTELEDIFGTSSEVETGIITFKKQRQLPPIKLWGVRINGGDVTEVYISFIPTNRGTIIMSEIPCRLDEIPSVESTLIRAGVTISALHNHWLGEEPRIMYLHWQALTQDPVELASNLQTLWNRL